MRTEIKGGDSEINRQTYSEREREKDREHNNEREGRKKGKRGRVR